jgi:hypothetical protein
LYSGPAPGPLEPAQRVPVLGLMTHSSTLFCCQENTGRPART